MAPLSFGTDGVRGRANDELSPEVAVAFGRAVVRALGVRALFVGRDTRQSGAMLAEAVCAGAASEGADVVDLGVLPTPGVAAHCVAAGAPGVVVSASHNPYTDNGLKVLSASGSKLDLDVEQAIEREFTVLLMSPDDGTRPSGTGVGTVRLDDGARAFHLTALRRAADDTSLAGLHVVLDCAHGAASGHGADVFRDLGATVTTVGDAPDGRNINDKVGSTAPQGLVDAVLEVRADLGIAVDGDADRCIAVDATGRVLDGDWLLALFATQLAREGALEGGVVVTVMSNLGLHHALSGAGIDVLEVPVGDRNVTDGLRKTGWTLGGEQSGHLVFAGRATTGDGLLTGVLLAQLVARSGPLHVLDDHLLETVPQQLVNVVVADASALERATSVWAQVDAIRVELGDRGRVVLRASGTEPLVRIMVEAEDEAQVQRIVDTLREHVLEALGPPGEPR